MKSIFVIASMIMALSTSAMTRVGIITDTHIGAKVEGVNERLEASYRLFKAHGITNIFHLGDVGEFHVKAYYDKYVEIRDRVYPEGVNEVFVYNSHDRFGLDAERGRFDMEPSAAFAATQKFLRAKNGAYHRFEMEGFTFLVYPQYPDLAQMDRELADAAKAHPNAPIFVLDHEPPMGTSSGSEYTGNPLTVPVYSKYPQVIVLSGHVHGSTANEGKIWQGAFTSIGFGALRDQHDRSAEFQVAIMDLTKDQAVIKRYDLATGREFRPEARWMLKFPYDQKNLAYDYATRARQFPQPKFAEGAKVRVIADEEDGGVWVKFPAVENPEWARQYEVRFGDSVFVTGDGQFAVLPEKRAREFAVKVSAALMQAGERVKVSVAPVGFFRNLGKAIAIDYKVGVQPDRGWKTVFTATKENIGIGDMVKDYDVALPKEILDFNPQSRYRAVLELSVEQGLAQGALFQIRIPTHTIIKEYVGIGSFQHRKFAFEFVNPPFDSDWRIKITTEGRGRIDALRIEKR